MMQIDEGVQDYVLRRLLIQIQKLVRIATYKNRQINKPGTCDHEEIEIQIEKLQLLLERNIENIRDPQKIMSEKTKLRSLIDPNTI